MADSDPVVPQAIHALSSIPVEHRRAVVRAYYLGQTVADIAAHEHIGESAVKSILHDALQGLRRAVQDGTPGQGSNGRHAL